MGVITVSWKGCVNECVTVPIQCICGIRRFAKLIKHGGVCLQDDDVVNHHSNKHHHHLQLVVDPQEYRARHQAQYTAVDEVLETVRITATKRTVSKPKDAEIQLYVFRVTGLNAASTVVRQLIHCMVRKQTFAY